MKLLKILILLCLASAGTSAWAVDTYTAANRQLIIPIDQVV